MKDLLPINKRCAVRTFVLMSHSTQLLWQQMWNEWRNVYPLPTTRNCHRGVFHVGSESGAIDHLHASLVLTLRETVRHQGHGSLPRHASGDWKPSCVLDERRWHANKSQLIVITVILCYVSTQQLENSTSIHLNNCLYFNVSAWCMHTPINHELVIYNSTTSR